MSHEVSFSIIVATKGRESLTRTLASITSQMDWGDEIIVTMLECPYGHRARNLAIPRCAGSHILFMDDDDRYADGALALAREKVGEAPDRVHVFSMRYMHGVRDVTAVLPLRCGTVGTPMIVCPNVPEKLGRFREDEYAGDWGFVETTMSKRNDQPVCHEEVIALIG